MKFSDSDGGANYIVPISNGLLRPPHVERIGPALMLFVLLEDLVTGGEGTDGLVHGGKPVADLELAKRLGLHRRTVSAYRRRLERHGYIRTVRTGSGYLWRVMKSKKWAWRQELERRQSNGDVENQDQRCRKSGPEMSKIRTERSQKLPSRSDKAGTKRTKRTKRGQNRLLLASQESNPWKILGSNLPMGSPKFQQRWEHYFATRDGNPISEAMERTILACQSRGVKVPPPFFPAKRVVEKREREELGRPADEGEEIARVEAPAWGAK